MKTVWSDGFLSVYVYAIKDIEPGEEIFLDYGDDYFEEEAPNPIVASLPKCHVYVGLPYRIVKKKPNKGNK